MSRPWITRLFDSALPSGNGYKVRLMGALLQTPFEIELVDPFADPPETRSAAFLRKNPNGKIPVVELSDGSFLSESGAILFYMAEGTPFLPTDSLARARVLQWMFFEQYSHEPNIAVLKQRVFWGRPEAAQQDEIERWRTRGQHALGVMDLQLLQTPYLVGHSYTIADVALYAYTHTAAETGYDLEALSGVRAWLERVAAHPRHVPIWGGPGSLTGGVGS
jgi:glutathione S-transferase